MLLEMVLWNRTFGPLTLLGIALVIAPTAWTLVRGRTAHRAKSVALPIAAGAGVEGNLPGR
jgi:hypothetical protein